MERHDERDVSRWADEQMARLMPDDEWEPNVARGLARLRGGGVNARAGRQRRSWIAAAAMVTVVVVSATSQQDRVRERYEGLDCRKLRWKGC